MSKEEVYIVIPVRSGSKGIPEKNLTYFGDESLLSRCLSKACQITKPENVILTSDSVEMLNVGLSFGVSTVDRTGDLAEDQTTLDPVIYDAMNTQKIRENDIVITMQVTSPNIQVKTIRDAIRDFKIKNIDTMISGKEQRHLSWVYKNGNYVPEYFERKNRQELEPRFLETGAFLITKKKFVNKNSRFGKKVEIYCVPESESEDIDTRHDLSAAHYFDKNQRIAIHVIGAEDTGTGHIFNCTEIARRLPEKEITFFIKPKDFIAIERIKNRNYDVIETNEIYKSIIDYRPAVAILDCLDTNIVDVISLKDQGIKVISFEDLGSGSHYTDHTFNALYPSTFGVGNIEAGPNYFMARQNQSFNQNIETENRKVDSVLVFLGGTDPKNHTETLIKLIERNDYKDIKFNFLFGLGKRKDNDIIKRVNNLENVNIIDFTPNILQLIAQHKIAITSGGRTMYELAMMKTPFVVLFQNDREKLHFRVFKKCTDITSYEVADNDMISGLRLMLNDQTTYQKIRRQLMEMKIGTSAKKIIDVMRN